MRPYESHWIPLSDSSALFSLGSHLCWKKGFMSTAPTLLLSTWWHTGPQISICEGRQTSLISESSTHANWETTGPLYYLSMDPTVLWRLPKPEMSSPSFEIECHFNCTSGCQKITGLASLCISLPTSRYWSAGRVPASTSGCYNAPQAHISLCSQNYSIIGRDSWMSSNNHHQVFTLPYA